jgi:hypothetical protein
MGKPPLVGRLRMLGMALLAMFALVGVVASGASAAPEWKGCVKTEPKNTGSYTDKLCTSPSPAGEGSYELAPSVGKGKGFKGKGGPTTLHTRTHGCTEGGCFSGGNELELKCTGVKYAGKVGLPNLIKEVVLEFKGCELYKDSPCQSGAKKGVIVTNSLAGEMIDIEGGSGVGSLLEAEAGPTSPLATFTCTETVEPWTLLGSVIAERTGDVDVIRKEAQEHFVVGAALGEVKWGTHSTYTPIVNVPTNETGGSIGEHLLISELTEPKHTEPAATLPSGLEGVTAEKGEALMITP